MVVRDGGVRGIVLHLSQLDAIRIEGSLVHAEAGALIIDVSKHAEQMPCQVLNSPVEFRVLSGVPWR